MKRKKKHEDHVDEGWLLPYSDMLTLLLALFIVMFAMAKIDDKKFQQIRNEFGSILSSHSDGGESIIGTVIDIKDNGNQEKSSESTTVASASKQEGILKEKLESQQMKETSERIKKELADSKLKDTAQVSLDSEGIHITLDGNILFDPGSAALTENMNETLTILSKSIRTLQENPIVIAGHTDNVPQVGGAYSDNWELSAARAISVMKYFVSQNTIQADNTSIQAYADTKPKASNKTAAGRSLNRRVELLIQRTEKDTGQK